MIAHFNYLIILISLSSTVTVLKPWPGSSVRVCPGTLRLQVQSPGQGTDKNQPMNA